MRRALRILSIATLLASGIAPAMAWAQDLKVGDKAPDFTLPGTDGKTYSLSQMRGKNVVLAWFPKAFTGG